MNVRYCGVELRSAIFQEFRKRSFFLVGAGEGLGWAQEWLERGIKASDAIALREGVDNFKWGISRVQNVVFQLVEIECSSIPCDLERNSPRVVRPFAQNSSRCGHV